MALPHISDKPGALLSPADLESAPSLGSPHPRPSKQPSAQGPPYQNSRAQQTTRKPQKDQGNSPSLKSTSLFFKESHIFLPLPPAPLFSQEFKFWGIILEENSRISWANAGPFLSAEDKIGPMIKTNIPGCWYLSPKHGMLCVISRHCVGFRQSQVKA